jgi:poly-gamma-glutamate synthesis protein (capsule biosynthesis protein)
MSKIDRFSGEFTLVTTGDSLIFQKISIFSEPEFLKVRDIVKSADVAFNNFETTIRNNKGFPRFKRDPTAWLTSPHFVLDELSWMGFNLFSLANNHSLDYSEEGLVETIEVFEDAGATHAGTGRNLSEARAPVYLNTPKARIALIGINTGLEDGLAGDIRGTVPGRPGLNPLRFTTTYYLKKPDFGQFAKISKALGLPEPKNGKLNFLEHDFAVGDKANIHTEPYKPDFDGNLRFIKEARKNADFVFVSVHNHEKRRPGEEYFDDQIEYIAEFVETFSKAAIDAGADAVLGHGTHCLNGIEIYKGHPIFYGLGNFISQSYQGNPKPYDWYEARGLHEKTYLDESEETEHPSGAAEERRIRRLTSGAVAEIVFKNRKPAQITLYPIELLKQQVQGGRPVLASGASADEILHRLSRLSADYGTKITIDKRIGKILISE